MKPGARLVAALALGIAGLLCFSWAGWRVRSEDRTPPRQEAPAGADDEMPGPSLAVSVNGVADSVARTGTPLLIEVAVATASGRGAETPLTLAAPSGWGTLIHIEAADANGKPAASFPARLVSSTGPSITLDARTIGQATFVVEFAAGGGLAPGAYSVTATIDTTATSGSAWKGKESSPAAELTIKPAEGSLSAEEERLLAIAEIRVQDALNRRSDALAACSRWLAAHPQDGQILEERGDLLGKSGNLKEAIAAYDAALATVPRGDGAKFDEPPFLLIRKRRTAAELLAKQPAPSSPEEVMIGKR